MLFVIVSALVVGQAYATNCTAGSYACPAGYSSCPTQSGAPTDTICTWSGSTVTCNIRESISGCPYYAVGAEIHSYSTASDEVEAWGTTELGNNFCCLCEGTSDFGVLSVVGGCKGDIIGCDDGAGTPTYELGFGASISASSGDDTIYGSAYADFITPYTGNDVVYAGAGDDVIMGLDTDLGDDDYDELYGEAGNDTISGGYDDDYIDGGADDDEIWGGAGNDEIYGGLGNDAIDGGAGNDVMNGGPGNDYMCGTTTTGMGNDEYYGGLGNDFMYSPAIANTPSGEDTSGFNYCGNTYHGSFLTGGSSCFYTLTSRPAGCP